MVQAHPGIIFVTTDTGERRAALVAGPQVWTVAESWLQHDLSERSAAAVAEALGLSVSDVEAALAYWADFREEIDQLVEREHANQDQALATWKRQRPLDGTKPSSSGDQIRPLRTDPQPGPRGS